MFTKLLLLLLQKKMSIRKVNTAQYKLTQKEYINHERIGANQNLNIKAVSNDAFSVRFKEHASKI